MSKISYVVPATIVDVNLVSSSSDLAACLLRQLLLYALALICKKRRCLADSSRALCVNDMHNLLILLSCGYMTTSQTQKTSL